jgi:ABC-2 type transport system permease protein
VALVVLRLKLALQRRAWGDSGILQRLGFVARWLLALLFGIGAAELVAWTQQDTGEVGAPLLVLLLTAVYLCWVLVPILVPGLADESVDPLKLAPYPVRGTDQSLGLTLGALVSPTALFTFLAAVGGAAAADESLLARAIVVALAVVFTVLCVTSSRAVQAVMAGILRRRRGRDALAVLVLALSAVVFLISQGTARDAQPLGLLLDARFTHVLAWLPPGAMAEAIAAARDEAWGTAAVQTAVGVATIVVALAAWAWAIASLVRGRSGSTGGRGTSAARTADLRLVPWPLSLLSPRPSIAAASQQLRYALFRSPKAMQSVVIAPVLGVVTAHAVTNEVGLVAGAVAFAAFSFTLIGINLFSFDDDAFTYLVTAGAPFAAVLRGKTWAPMLLLGPVVLAFVGVEATLEGQWSQAAAAVIAALAIGALALAVGSVLSVRRPLNLVTRSGGGAHGLTTTLSGLLVVGAVLALAAYLWSLLDPELGSTVTALALAVGSVPVVWGLHRWAAMLLVRDPWRVEQALAH